MTMVHYKRLQSRKGTILKVHPVMRVIVLVGGVVLAALVLRQIVIRTAQYLLPIYSENTAHLFSSKRALASKIAALQNTINAYDAKLVELNTLKYENIQLKTELGRNAPAKGILAHVRTLPNRSFYDTFIIDSGLAEGVQVGQIVYAFDSIALGTISRVEDHFATVELYSASGRETVGTAEGSGVAVTLVGRSAGEYEVRMPRNVPFDIGSLITIQSVHTATIATVEKVITDVRDPFQRLLAKTPVNLQALKWVIVR